MRNTPLFVACVWAASMTACITQSPSLAEGEADGASGLLGDGGLPDGEPVADAEADGVVDDATDATPRPDLDPPVADAAPPPDQGALPPPCGALELVELGQVAVADSDGRTWHVTVRRDVAYVTHQGGLTAVNVGDPARPAVIGEVRHPIAEGAFGLDTASDVGLLAVVGDGVRAIDVARPAAMREVGAFDLVGAAGAEYARDIHVIGDRAYVAALKQGVWVVERGAAAPRPLGTCCGTPGGHPLDGPSAVYVVDDRAFVADTEAGLREVGLDGDRPASIGTTPMPGTARSIAVRDDLAFVGLDDGSLVEVDVTRPGAAFVRRVHARGGPIRHLDVEADRLAVSLGPAGVEVLDVRAPSPPLATAEANDAVTAVDLVEQRLYVTDGVMLRVMDLRCSGP